MKNILAFAAIASLSATAFAASPTVDASFSRDYGSESKLTVSQATNVGTFDIGVLSTRYRQTVPGMDDSSGYELGYSNGTKVGPFALTGRIGYGRLTDVNGGGGFFQSTNYVTIGGEAKLPVTSNINAYANYRHRNPRGDGPIQNRVQAGAEFAVAKGVAARLGVSHARQFNDKGTGVNVSVNYTF